MALDSMREEKTDPRQGIVGLSSAEGTDEGGAEPEVLGPSTSTAEAAAITTATATPGQATAAEGDG